jgi:hypothetical protein
MELVAKLFSERLIKYAKSSASYFQWNFHPIKINSFWAFRLVSSGCENVMSNYKVPRSTSLLLKVKEFIKIAVYQVTHFLFWQFILKLELFIIPTYRSFYFDHYISGGPS